MNNNKKKNFLHECFNVTFANFIFSHPKYYKYSLPLVLTYSVDNDDMKSSKRHATLLALIFLLKCFRNSFIFFYKLNRFEIKDKGNHLNETRLRQKDFVSNLKGKIK